LTGGNYLKNKLLESYLISFIAFLIGFIEIFFKHEMFSPIEGFNSGFLMVGLGILIFILTIISHIKYYSNKKQMDIECSKEYDERDELIDGKVANLTMKVIIILIFIIMFMTNFINIQTNNALFIIILASSFINILAKKFYNNYY